MHKEGRKGYGISIMGFRFGFEVGREEIYGPKGKRKSQQTLKSSKTPKGFWKKLELVR